MSAEVNTWVIASSGLLGALLAINFALVLLHLFSRHVRFIELAAFAFMSALAYSTLLDKALSLWQLSVEDSRRYWLIFCGVSLLAASRFSMALMATRALASQIKLAVNGICWLIVVLLSLSFVVDMAQPLVLALYIALSLLIGTVAFILWQQEKAQINAWIGGGWIVQVAVFAFALKIFEFSDSTNAIYAYMVMLLLTVSGCALWFFVVSKQYVEHKTKLLAEQQQQLAKAHAHEQMQQELLHFEEQAREEAEAKAQERTFELEVTLRELQDANRELEEKNTQDALTGIRNRRFFDKKYLAEFRRSRRERTELSLVMLDIDHFKKVNDNYGHLAGDDVIRYVGRALSDILKRPSDECCRYGGEEFALILPNTDADGAQQVAETLRQKLQEASINTDAGIIKITVSCGLYTGVAELEMNQNLFIEYADQALYYAKQNGRNRVVHYSELIKT